MLCQPLVFAQSLLLTAEDFVLLAGTDVTVAGPGPNVFSNGDVGAAASISGFPPAIVENGTTILGGVIVGQALDDLITASNALNAMPSPPANNLTSVNGGDLASQILAPGVYKFDVAASISLNGVLTLDAQGQNNVVWVINIGTSLTTGENAKVEFINLGSNGGADNGLFWNAGSAITLGATNVIAGNYLAGTDITFGTTVPGTGSGSGRALAQAGVTFDGPATMDVLGGPGNGDLAGGLTFDGGSLVPSGYVLLSSEGTYTQGASSVVLAPGKVYSTLGVVVDGGSADTNPLNPATLTVFQTIAELTGTNTYTGGTIVDGGQLTTASQNLPTNGAVSLIDSNNTGTTGSIIFDQGIDGTFGGIVSGAGSLTKENTAELTLTGANTYTGGTFVNEGTLIASAAALPVAGEVTLATNTLLVFDEFTDSTYAGNITGTGALEKHGVGTLALTGVNTYQGGTVVDGGTLSAGTQNLPTNGAISLIDSNSTGTMGSIIFDQSSVGIFGGIVSGAGSLIKENTAELTLTGANTYTGGTFVNEGTLVASTASLPDDGDITLATDTTVVFDEAIDSIYAGDVSGTGTLEKHGVGTLSLTGVNTYQGGTIVDGGALSAGSQNLPTNGAISLIDSNSTGTMGSIIFDQDIDGTFGGIVSGAGSLIKENTAELTLTGANTYTGGTFVNEGTLIASAAALPVAGDITLATDTTVVFDEFINSSYGGNITGDGTLEKQGFAALALTGTNTYTGGTFVNEGTLVANTASLPDAGDITLATDTTVVFDEANNTIYAGDITGTGTLEKQGTGTLELANATTAMLDIQTGSLFINGDAGATTVASGGLLGGIGTINGNLTNNGIVSPGFSPGTIFVAGNYTQGPGGTLVIQFASAISYDQLIITGTASLDGTLQLDFLGGYAPVGESFEILTAAGGVSGTFDPVTGSAAIAADVTYNPNNVTVAFVQVPFTAFAGTPNQNAVAAAAADSPDITTALNAIPNPDQMASALNALSPQGYQIWSNIAFDHATSLTDRLARNRTNLPDRGNYYFEGGQRRGSVNGDSDVGSASYRSDFGLAGGNFAIGPDFTLGGFFEYTKTNSDLGSSGSNSEIKKKTLGARAAWSSNQWFVHAVLAYGMEDYKSRRWIQFPGTSEMASSETSGRQWIANISAGRDFTSGPLTVTPFAGLLASYWKADGFQETGAGAFNVTVGDQSAESLRTQLGVAIAADFVDIHDVRIRPHARMAWMHELSDSQRTINSAFGATQFQTRTTKVKRDSLLLGVGLDLGFTPNATLYSHLSTRIGNNEDRLTREWLIGFNYSF
jgi:autotransporter-associated beta strand protein